MAKQPSGTFAFRGTRTLTPATANDPGLGALELFPGTWANLRDPDNRDGGPLDGRGWNMIALPFAPPPGAGVPPFRVLMNQYNEKLVVTTKDDNVPNRGIHVVPVVGTVTETDQTLVALDYEQGINHIATEDFPVSGLTQPVPSGIHHEPGLLLFFENQVENGVDLARLGTIPHGDSLLALGKSQPAEPGPPKIPTKVDGFPIGLDPKNPQTPKYLAAYDHFIKNPFKGVVTAPGFPGFRPDDLANLLAIGFPGTAKKTTTFKFSTTLETGGIVNIPFIVKQANATEMESTFWISELDELDADGDPKLIMQYLQIVMLEFFDRNDGVPGLIKWPHVSINTMERIAKDVKPAPLRSADASKTMIA